MTFLAPDNGLLTGIVSPRDRVREVTNRQLFRADVSQTFHGRDVFAPVAARLAAGLAMEDVGAPVASLRTLDVPAPRRLPDGGVAGRILHVDAFGNLISNVRAADIATPESCVVHLAGRAIGPLVTSYAAAADGAPLAIIGSLGLVEIAVNRGNAAKVLSAGVGTELVVRSP
jgi:S-adenosylmethionine hydrolase